MAKIYLTCILLSTSLFAFSTQIRKFKFGEISNIELKEKSYPGDSTVQAAVLFDVQIISMELGILSRHTKTYH